MSKTIIPHSMLTLENYRQRGEKKRDRKAVLVHNSLSLHFNDDCIRTSIINGNFQNEILMNIL